MDKYQVTRVLGEGAFGKVLEARNQIESGARVAIKQIKANFKSWDECKNLRELKALKNLRHVHIVRLREMILEKVRLVSRSNITRTRPLKLYIISVRAIAVARNSILFHRKYCALH